MENQDKAGPRWIAGIEPPAEMRTLSMAEIFEKECREQPQRLAQLFRAYSQEKSILEEMDKIRQWAFTEGPVLFIGMGASFCSSVSGSTWLQSCGRSSFVVDAGEWLHYSLEAWEEVAASILVTTSGESKELVELCQRPAPKPVALLCNNEKSTCWSRTQIHLPILAGPEYGNATKTYSNATAACIVLASHISGRPWQGDADRFLVAYAETLNQIFSKRAELEKFCRGAANIELIGRGAAYGGAIMGSLGLREMTGRRTASHTGAGFRHGPLLDVNDSHLAIILALGRTADLGVKLAGDCNERGGKVILVTTDERQPSEKLLPVRISAVPEPWEGANSVLVPQALTLGIIEQFGANLRPRFHYGTMEE